MNKYFTKDHEWVTIDGDIATVGITQYAQNQLGDIVFIELPEIDEEFAKDDDISVVESVKAAGDVHSPISGKVIEINEILEDEPAIVNTNPEKDGWIYKMQISDSSELDKLMTEDDYQKLIAK